MFDNLDTYLLDYSKQFAPEQEIFSRFYQRVKESSMYVTTALSDMQNTLFRVHKADDYLRSDKRALDNLSNLVQNSIVKSDITNMAMRIKEELDKIAKNTEKDNSRFSFFGTQKTGYRQQFQENLNAIQQLADNERIRMIKLKSDLERTLNGLIRHTTMTENRVTALTDMYCYLTIALREMESRGGYDKETVGEIAEYLNSIYEDLKVLNSSLKLDYQNIEVNRHYFKELNNALKTLEITVSLYIQTSIVLNPNRNPYAIIYHYGRQIDTSELKDVKTEAEVETYLQNASKKIKVWHEILANSCDGLFVK